MFPLSELVRGYPKRCPSLAFLTVPQGLIFGLMGVRNLFNDYMEQPALDLLPSNHFDVVNLKVIIKDTGVLQSIQYRLDAIVNVDFSFVPRSEDECDFQFLIPKLRNVVLDYKLNDSFSKLSPVLADDCSTAKVSPVGVHTWRER